MSVNDAMLAAPLRSLVRREELLETGGWNEFLPHAGDHELFLRLRKRADFVYVQYVTSQRYHSKDATLPAPGVLLGEHLLLHVLHPVAGRPVLLERRANVLAYLRAQRDFSITPPPVRLSAAAPITLR